MMIETTKDTSSKIRIDQEFKALIPALTPEEYSGLESSIKSDGCRDSIIVWNNTIVDGHNRYDICQKNNIPFKVFSKEFLDRDDVIDWMCSNQLSRRNLAPEMISYIRGKQYEVRKRQGNRTDLTLDHNDPKSNTAEKIGAEQHVSGPTIKRDAEYAKAVDAIGESLGQDVKQRILSGEINIDKKEVVALKKANDKLNTGLFTSDSEEWYTPPEILDAVYAVFNNELQTDPCSPVDSPRVNAKVHYTKEDDGLKQSWTGTVFMNPPYGNVIGDWTRKALEEYKNGKATEIIILVPARVDTAWFQELTEWPWCGVKGRLKFSDSKNSAPFPSAIFYIGENLKGFFECFDQFGPIFRRVDYEEANVS